MKKKKIKQMEKISTKPTEQSRERLHVEWLLFSRNENTLSSQAG